MLGPRLLSYHNVYLLNALMRDARDAIGRGAWASFRKGADHGPRSGRSNE